MAKIFFDTGISLDGFMAGDNRGPHNPIGDGSITIHQWMYRQKTFFRNMGMEGDKDGPENKLFEAVFARTGAYIMGKRMFEEGEKNGRKTYTRLPFTY